MKLKAVKPQFTDEEKDLLIGEIDVAFAITALTSFARFAESETGAAIAFRMLDEIKKGVQVERDWQKHSETHRVVPFHQHVRNHFAPSQGEK
jgi:hypothetical protein